MDHGLAAMADRTPSRPGPPPGAPRRHGIHRTEVPRAASSDTSRTRSRHGRQEGRRDDRRHPDRTADQGLRRPPGHHRPRPEVEQGEIFGFLGPNGAGKTTTMRVLLDLIRPTSGRADGLRHRDDRRPGRDPPARRLPARRVRPVRPADRRADHRVLREPARRGRPGLRRRARSSASTSTRAGSSGSTRRATSRRSASWSRSSTGRTC